MMKRRSLLSLVAAAAVVSGLTALGAPARAAEKEIVYLTTVQLEQLEFRQDRGQLVGRLESLCRIGALKVCFGRCQLLGGDAGFGELLQQAHRHADARHQR